MLKIRDLGINVVPLTTRLPAPGGGSRFGAHIDPLTKYRQRLDDGTTSCNCVTCVPCSDKDQEKGGKRDDREQKRKPTTKKAPSKKSSKKSYRTDGFSNGAAVQLRRQLDR